ncbi:MAG: rod shape-determining protein MreD [Peptococcales bacterium]|jgi:rod shape-determining protein MreD
MRYLVLALLGFFSLILQSTIFNEFLVAGVKPDLLLIIVIFFALFNGPRQGAFIGLGLGLLEDLFQAKYFGLNAASKLTTGLIIGFMEKRIYKDNFLVPILVLFIGSFIHMAFYYLYTNIVGYSVGVHDFFRVAVPFAIYNMCFAPFTYGPFYKSSTKGILKRHTSA